MVEDETARLAALRSYRILEPEPEQPFDDLTTLAALVCGAPIALTRDPCIRFYAGASLASREGQSARIPLRHRPRAANADRRSGRRARCAQARPSVSPAAFARALLPASITVAAAYARAALAVRRCAGSRA